MVCTRVTYGASHLGMLQVRHVTRYAAATRRLGTMMRVRFDTIADARMAARTLPVVEATRERRASDVAIALRVRIVTVGTAHASVAVALAEALRLLVREGPHATIGRQGTVAEQRQSERVESLQRIAGKIAGSHLILERVALIAHPKRLFLVERGEWPHADVCGTRHLPGPCQLDVTTSRSVTGLAIDGERRDARGVAVSAGVEPRLDLAAVAPLTVGEAGQVAEHAHRRPVAARGERHVRGDWFPSLAGARAGVAEPSFRRSAQLERKKAHGAIGAARHEALRTAAGHVAASHHAVHGQRLRRASLLLDDERVLPASGPARRDQRIAEANWASIERGEHDTVRRRAAGPAVCRAFPRAVFSDVTTGAARCAHEVGACNNR